ncbi:MAG: GxxExxY protein [Desulfovibrionales bacterium]|nr:GxxExxY protein [Desulfovibrionales bacterium]
MTENELSKIILDAAFKIHRALGPGLLESAYEACLVYELKNTGLKVENQCLLPVSYEGVQVDAGYRIDILVEDKIILELKSVDQIAPIHEAQLLTYLKLSGCKLGFLLNFNVTLLKDGIKRMVNGL